MTGSQLYTILGLLFFLASFYNNYSARKWEAKANKHLDDAMELLDQATKAFDQAREIREQLRQTLNDEGEGWKL